MSVCVCYLQGLDKLLSPRNVGNVDGCTESVQHPHFLEDIFTAGGADDEQLTTLTERHIEMCSLTQLSLSHQMWILLNDIFCADIVVIQRHKVLIS